jgi:hypothetical protein
MNNMNRAIVVSSRVSAAAAAAMAVRIVHRRHISDERARRKSTQSRGSSREFYASLAPIQRFSATMETISVAAGFRLPQ